MGIDWLQTQVAGFGALSGEERAAIIDFSLLWSLFEARILDTHGSAQRICDAIQCWEDQRNLNAGEYDDEFAYFQNRYFSEGQFTDHFAHLNLRQNDCPDLVEGVLQGVRDSPVERVSAVFIIIWRYRNNLFHGPKWQYHLQGQEENFRNANSVLMKALERHGRLDEA